MKPLRTVRLVLAVAALLLSVFASAENRIALIVGNDDYRGDFSPLPTCVNDAREMARCLDALGYKTTVLTNATRAELMDAVHSMQGLLAGGNATGIFFYSGHAVAIGGESYIVPARTDVSPENITFREECLSVGSISKLFRGSCPRSLLFLDACRDIVHSDTKGGWSPSKNVVRGKGNEQVICYATAYGKVARAGRQGLSPFTQVLTSHLFDPESFMSIWLHKVEDEVEALSGQTPVLEGGFSSDFYFNGSGAAAPARPSQPADTQSPGNTQATNTQATNTQKPADTPQQSMPRPGTSADNSDFAGRIGDRVAANFENPDELIANGRKLDNSAATIAEAIRLYRKAADMGNVEAMYLLGKAYTFGNRATKDKTQARIWLDRAEASGIQPWCAMAASLKRQLAL